MADLPILQKPYENISTDADEPPKGPKIGKVSRAALALQGLKGAM